jgi:hypothetical protein
MSKVNRLVAVGLALLVGLAAGCNKQRQPSPPATAVAVATADAPDGNAAVEMPASTAPAAGGGRKLALLVGVSKYDHLEAWRQLIGPANDVDAVGHVLRDRGFEAADIVTLREPPGATAGRPTRANILRELDRLAVRAQAGDWVVVYVAGHGAVVPRPAGEAADDDANPRATTGLFLPCDAVPANPYGGPDQVGNAIEDHEFSDRIKPILDKGAWVWLIDDSCQSAGLVRGADDVYRAVPPSELGIRDEDMRRAEQLDAQRAANHAAPTTRPGLAHVIDSPRFAATYACTRDQHTPEMPLPYDAAGPMPAATHGLFSYYLCRAIDSAPSRSPLTIAELINRVHLAYETFPRPDVPCPVAEGKARDNLLFSGDTRRAGMQLSRAKQGWTVNAGLLASLNGGSVLAVFPPGAADTTGKPFGYLRVDRADPFTATVSPVAYDGLRAPAAAELAAGELCKAALYDFGVDPLRVSVEPVAVDPADDKSAPAVAAGSAAVRSADPAVVHAAEAERADLQAFTRDCHLVAVVDAHANPRPQWRVVTHRNGADVRTSLVCVASGVTFSEPADKGGSTWVRAALSKISRGENLLKIAGAATAVSDDPDGPKVELSLTVTPNGSHTPQPFNPAAGGLVLHAGDQVRFRMSNVSVPSGNTRADVTLLFLDADFGIKVLYPTATVGDNRIGPGESRDYANFVNSNTTGTERVLLIAQVVDPRRVPAPADFSWLEETGIAKDTTRGGEPAADNELGRLLMASHFQADGVSTRGLGSGDASRAFMRVITWDTQR